MRFHVYMKTHDFGTRSIIICGQDSMSMEPAKT